MANRPAPPPLPESKDKQEDLGPFRRGKCQAGRLSCPLSFLLTSAKATIFGPSSGFSRISAKMYVHFAETCLYQTSFILYMAVDGLIPAHGKSVAGLDEFAAALDHNGIPTVWVSSRTRLQLDEPRRKLAHTHPFIAEDGSGVFLPEDYFHLKPQTSHAQPKSLATIRLGRFTCLPIAKPQPAAAEALEALADETDVDVVSLRSLAPRELAQNSGLPQREAELARQRDFDELFFFAGASEKDIANFRTVGIAQGIQLRQRGVLWSLSIGASVKRCVTELSKLYDRALRSHARTIALATPGQESSLFASCDRAILLTDNADAVSEDVDERTPSRSKRVMEVPVSAPDKWDQVLAALSARH